MKKLFATIFLTFGFLMIICSCGTTSVRNTPRINYSKLNCEAVSDFSEGVQWVTRDEVTYNSNRKLFGLIDEKGNFLIEMTSEYTDVEPFCDGAAWVEVGTNQYRAIDRHGVFLTGIYKETYNFCDDVAWVKNSENNWLVIDKSDNAVFTYDAYEGIERFSQFSEGKCIVVLSENIYGKKTAYVLDKSGDLEPLSTDVISYDLDANLGVFVDGYARCGEKWNESDGTAFRNLAYVREDGSVLVLKNGSGGGLSAQQRYSAPAFEGLEIWAAGNFKNGKANIIFKGMDELYYKIQIDENGNFIGEPKNGISMSAIAGSMTSMRAPAGSDITFSEIIKMLSGNGFID